MGRPNWLWGRHHWAEALGSSGALLCVCSEVSCRGPCGAGGRATLLERGTMTCDIRLLPWLVCVSRPCD